MEKNSNLGHGWFQGCQIFLGAWYQNWKKCTKWTQNIPNVHKIFRMAINYINIFQTEALKFFPKFLFLVWKQTIWQPWLVWKKTKPTKHFVKGCSYLQATINKLRWNYFAKMNWTELWYVHMYVNVDNSQPKSEIVFLKFGCCFAWEKCICFRNVTERKINFGPSWILKC
jgi:hypothetical protein